VKPLVGWNEAQRSLVFSDGENILSEQPVQVLRLMGWSGEDADYRRSLPRVDISPLMLPAPPTKADLDKLKARR
jgi:hypothetical protein